ncbi:MAG: helix-turn-helix transcriptional regulator [Planctomycetota bacterium]
MPPESQNIANGDIPRVQPLRPGESGHARLFLNPGGPGRGPNPGHRHDEWEFNLIDRGWVEYLIRGQRYRLPTDSLTWLLPQQPHVLIDHSRDMRMWVGIFSEALVRQMTRDAGLSRWQRLLDRDRSVELQGRILAEPEAEMLGGLCRRVADLDGTTHQRGKAGVAWLLSEAFQVYEHAADIPAGTHLHPAVEHAARLLHERAHLRDADDLDAIAERCHVSRAHLSRLFARQIGMSLTDFRARQRVRLFRELVGRGSRLTLEEAATAAGFGSYAQCYRSVRRELGCRPNQIGGLM